MYIYIMNSVIFTVCFFVRKVKENGHMNFISGPFLDLNACHGKLTNNKSTGKKKLKMQM